MITADQPSIFDSAKLRVHVSSRQDGNMKYEQGADAAANLAGFAHANDIEPSQLVVMYVNDPDRWDAIHEATAEDAGAGADNPEARIHADALVTAEPNLALLLPIADCCPVVLHDPVHQVVALVHLGWQSSEADLLAKTIAYLQDKHAASPADMRAYMGPCISGESYVLADRPRQAGDSAWQDFVKRRDDGWHIDLPGYNYRQLLAAGVAADNIQRAAADTATSRGYFSHYRAGMQGTAMSEGRFAVMVTLQGFN